MRKFIAILVLFINISVAGMAQSVGALPHPGDLTHAMFLHHMALNGVEIIREIA